MTTAAIAMDGSDNLTFVQSESKPVGMHGPLMDKLRDNAPRIVGALKFLGIGIVFLSGEPMLIACGVFFVTAQLIAMAYGTKENQKKLAEERKTGNQQEVGVFSKMFSPRKYPVESSSGFAAVAEVFETGYGVQLANASGLGAGIATIFVGLAAMWSYGNILFGKEKKKEETPNNPTESLVFAKSESKPVGFFGRFRQFAKDNPVFVSSATLIGLCAIAIVGGILGGAASPWYIAGLTLGLVANVIQTIFVTQKGFNVEGAAEEKQKSHQDRLIEQRARGNDLGVQPA
jgi:hypothetical protein